MPGQRGTEKRVLTGQVLVRLPSGTADAVHASAVEAGLTDAAWIRRKLVDLLGTDADDAIPTATLPAHRPAPTMDIVEIARLRESVGEAVGTLRQVAGIDRARTGARLDELDAAITKLIAAGHELDTVKARLMRGGV